MPLWESKTRKQPRTSAVLIVWCTASCAAHINRRYFANQHNVPYTRWYLVRNTVSVSIALRCLSKSNFHVGGGEMEVNSVANRGVLLARMPDELLFKSGWFKTFSDAVMQFLRTENKEGTAVITSDLQLFKELRSNPEAVTPEKLKALSLKYAPELESTWIDSETPDEKEALGAWWLLKIVLNIFLSKQPALQFEKLNDFLADEKKAVAVYLQQKDSSSVLPHIEKWICDDWESSAFYCA